MSDYLAFSQIAVDDLIAYMRLNEVSTEERTLLGSILASAKSYVLHYTGRTEEKADTIPEFTIAVFTISEDMYDKRTYEIDVKGTNPIVDSILGARSVNLL